jgi:hypothetical protein
MRIKTWTLSDEFWGKIKDEIPKPKRDPKREYKRKAGRGRKPADTKGLEGILYVLRTVCQ